MVQIAAALLLLGAIALIVESAVLFARGWAKGTIRDSLAYMVLLPARRNRALAAFAIMTIGFLAAAIARISAVLGYINLSSAQVASGIALLAGSIGMSVLVFVGLDPRPLDRTERLFLDQPSHILYSVGVVDKHESGLPKSGESS
ncbi:MAG: hypothetical protein ACRECT_07145 [Thermoplasmata archaeon]